MKQLLVRLAAREGVEHLREQIDALTTQLAEAGSALTRLETTRETLLAMVAEGEAEATADPVLSTLAYRQILAAFEAAGTGLRAKDLCLALDIGLGAKQTDGMRAKLKRLVGLNPAGRPDESSGRPAGGYLMVVPSIAGGWLVAPTPQLVEDGSVVRVKSTVREPTRSRCEIQLLAVW